MRPGVAGIRRLFRPCLPVARTAEQNPCRMDLHGRVQGIGFDPILSLDIQAATESCGPELVRLILYALGLISKVRVPIIRGAG